MSQVVQEINPLEISFSNDKGFEPSTPSSASPPSDKPKACSKLHIKTPVQIWEQTKLTFTPPLNIKTFKIETPPSRNAPRISQSLNKYKQSPKNAYSAALEARHFSAHKRAVSDYISRDSLYQISPFTSISSPSYHSVGYSRQTAREKKKANVMKWDRIDATSHLKEISRLNDLINRVNTHVNVYNRLYPMKKR